MVNIIYPKKNFVNYRQQQIEFYKKNVTYDSFETADSLVGAVNNFLQNTPLKKLCEALDIALSADKSTNP